MPGVRRRRDSEESEGLYASPGRGAIGRARLDFVETKPAEPPSTPAVEPPITPTVEVPRDEPPAPRRFFQLSRAGAALAVAVLADGVQILGAPLFFAGAVEPWNDAIDVAVGAVMIGLLGWHLAFLPSFVNKLIPFTDLFPSWTLAVLYVARKGKKP